MNEMTTHTIDDITRAQYHPPQTQSAREQLRMSEEPFATPYGLLRTLIKPKDIVRLLYSTPAREGEKHGQTYIAEGIVIRVNDDLVINTAYERNNEFHPFMDGIRPTIFRLNGTPLTSLYVELIGETVRGGDGEERYVKRRAKPLLHLPTTAD